MKFSKGAYIIQNYGPGKRKIQGECNTLELVTIWHQNHLLTWRGKVREKVTRTWRIKAVRRDPFVSFGDGLSQSMERELEKLMFHLPFPPSCISLVLSWVPRFLPLAKAIWSQRAGEPLDSGQTVKE